jgi:hypothetical protein
MQQLVTFMSDALGVSTCCDAVDCRGAVQPDIAGRRAEAGLLVRAAIRERGGVPAAWIIHDVEKQSCITRVQRQSREIIEPRPVRAGKSKETNQSPSTGVPDTPGVGVAGW